MRELIERIGTRFSRGTIRYAMFASFTVSALLAILLTAPLGAFGMDHTYRRLLRRAGEGEG